MYQLNLTEFTQEEFLRDYWQKKPVVIRKGFVDFKDPISADEIAGLACEEAVQSRLVHKEGENWLAAFGPFQNYDHLGDKNWSLVVQALDNWSEEAAQMIEPFRFIPHWRLDDLMVSFATPGGSVGPHIDWYDVFICQGSGSRHWRVGDIGNYKEFAAHAALLHVEPFEAIIDVELQPGDILYIPPGFPHEGITLETSLSFSVGFRTNSSQNLLSAFADHLIDNNEATDLIKDPTRKMTNNSAAIDTKDYALIKEHMLNVFDNDKMLRKFIGSFLTEAKHELALEPEENGLTDSDIVNVLKSHSLMRLGGLRAFYFTETVDEGVCFINGEEVCFPAEISPAIKLLCDNVCVTPNTLTHWHMNDAFIEFIKQQIELGYWYFTE